MTVTTRLAVEKSLKRYDLAADKTATLAHDVLRSVAAMVAADLGMQVRFVVAEIDRERRVKAG
jgi:hypothetical protein